MGSRERPSRWAPTRNRVFPSIKRAEFPSSEKGIHVEETQTQKKEFRIRGWRPVSPEEDVNTPRLLQVRYGRPAHADEPLEFPEKNLKVPEGRRRTPPQDLHSQFHGKWFDLFKDRVDLSILSLQMVGADRGGSRLTTGMLVVKRRISLGEHHCLQILFSVLLLLVFKS